MGALLPIALGAGAGFAAGKVLQSATRPSAPVQAPPVPQAIEPPKATADTTQAGEQARRDVPRGRQETFLTGDLTPSEEELRGKKRFLGGR